MAEHGIEGSPRSRPRRRGLLIVGLAALAAPRPARANWPDRPVRIVIPFGAGGPIDTVGRPMAEYLRERLGQPFFIENRSGAGGSIGLRAVMQAAPDGTTLLLTSSSLASLAALYPSQDLDPRTGVTPISLVAEVPTTLVVRAAGPLFAVLDVIAAAKARPGELTFGSAGVGSSNHLAGALFAQATGVELTHVPYRGAAAATTALYAGEIDLVFTSTVETMPHVRAGRLRLLGLASERRNPLLPDVAVIAESVPGYAAPNWYALAGPRGLPPTIVQRLNATLAPLREDAEFRIRLAAAGTEPLMSPPEVLVERLAQDVPRWQRVVVAAGIKVE
jgi:tripartite-type tricarboxylate transporter receptor subunit TctC